MPAISFVAPNGVLLTMSFASVHHGQRFSLDYEGQRIEYTVHASSDNTTYTAERIMPLPQLFIDRAVETLNWHGLSVQAGSQNVFSPGLRYTDGYLPPYDLFVEGRHPASAEPSTEMHFLFAAFPVDGIPSQTFRKTVAFTNDTLISGQTLSAAVAAREFATEILEAMPRLYPQQSRQWLERMQAQQAAQRTAAQQRRTIQAANHGVERAQRALEAEQPAPERIIGDNSFSSYDNNIGFFAPSHAYTWGEATIERQVRPEDTGEEITNDMLPAAPVTGRRITHTIREEAGVFDRQLLDGLIAAAERTRATPIAVYTSGDGMQELNGALTRTVTVNSTRLSSGIDGHEFHFIANDPLQIFKPRNTVWGPYTDSEENTWKPEPNVPVFDFGF